MIGLNKSHRGLNNIDNNVILEIDLEMTFKLKAELNKVIFINHKITLDDKFDRLKTLKPEKRRRIRLKDY